MEIARLKSLSLFCFFLTQDQPRFAFETDLPHNLYQSLSQSETDTDDD
jgi:hypothetical protein